MACGAPDVREPAYQVSRSFGAVSTAGLAPRFAHAVPAAFTIAAAALVVTLAAAALAAAAEPFATAAVSLATTALPFAAATTEPAAVGLATTTLAEPTAAVALAAASRAEPATAIAIAAAALALAAAALAEPAAAIVIAAAAIAIAAAAAATEPFPATADAAAAIGAFPATAAGRHLRGQGLPADGGLGVQFERGLSHCDVWRHRRLARLGGDRLEPAFQKFALLQRGHLQLGHLQCHDHAQHVHGALPALCTEAVLPAGGCPAPQNLQSRALPSTLRAPRPAAASRLPARSSPRIVCPALLAPSAVRVHLQPAAELGHVQRHKHVRHVLRALLSPSPNLCSPALSPAPCEHRARARSPPPACRRHAQLAAHREPCLRPRQWASAFNQPLSWDTRRVTHMRNMFYVRCYPRPDPASVQSRPHPPASSHTRSGALVHAVGRRLTPPGPQLAPHRLPCLRPRQDATTFNQPLSWDTSGVTDMSYMFQVHSPAALPP